MAEIIGNPGHNALEESHKRFRIKGWTCYILVLLSGVFLGWIIPVKLVTSFGSVSVFLFLSLLAVVIFRKMDRLMSQYEKARKNWRKGADGEELVSEILHSLPDNYVVVNDISKRFGNIDHVVIGPSGIYVINTKNWRGTVTLDDNGELLWNGKKTDRPEVHNFSHAVMDFHGKIKALCEKDYFINGILVFVGTYVHIGDTQTKHIHCRTDEQLIDYIQNEKFTNRLKPEDIKHIRKAVIEMTRMDDKFAK